MNTLPTWAASLLVILLALMMASLAALVVIKAITEAIRAEDKIQQKRRTSETKALNNWKRLYEEEHQAHVDEVASLINDITDLQKQLSNARELLGKVKVADL